uniref:Uncharacterized protein n=1 Tax=Wuchereria bancrofti TaxID=6293 RepID=A0A1I8ESU4_WUCBA
MDLEKHSKNYPQQKSSVIIVISLAQCSHKKPRFQDRKDKAEIQKKVKNAHTPAPEEKMREKQDKSNSPDEKKRAAPEEQHTSAVEDAEKEKERLKEMEEKRIEEIKPKIMKRNAKEERIAKGKETRGKGDYPTMDDVLSDWDSERDGKKKNEDDDQKSRANTNLEDVDDIRKVPLLAFFCIKLKKSSGRGAGKYATKGSKKNAKEPSDSIKKVDKTAGSQICKLQKLNPSTIISDKYVSIRRQDRAVIKFITSFELQTGSLTESKLEPRILKRSKDYCEKYILFNFLGKTLDFYPTQTDIFEETREITEKEGKQIKYKHNTPQ